MTKSQVFQSSRKLLFEMLVVFLGVLAAFWVENYRELKRIRSTGERILEAFQFDLQQHLAWFVPWYKERESKRLSWLSERNKGGRIPPFYIRMPGARGFPRTTWDAAVATDALRVIEPQLVRQIGNFYHESNGIGDQWLRYIEHTDRFVLPVQYSKSIEFLDPESGRYIPEIQVNIQLMNEVWFESFDKFYAWPTWMNGEIQDYLDELNGDETNSLLCAVSENSDHGTLTIVEEVDYSKIDWPVESLIEKGRKEINESTETGVCWVTDAENRKPCRLAMYYENLAIKSELLRNEGQSVEELRTQSGWVV